MDTFKVHPVKTRKLAQDQYSRTHTLIMLPVGASIVSVCKFMFLRSLGLQTDGRMFFGDM